MKHVELHSDVENARSFMSPTSHVTLIFLITFLSIYNNLYYIRQHSSVLLFDINIYYSQGIILYKVDKLSHVDLS